MSKIVFLAGDFPPLEGGISIYLYTLAQQFFPDEVVVIGLPVPGWQVFDSKQKFKIKRLPIPGSWGSTSPQFKYLAPLYYWELAKGKNIDYVICGQAHHSLMIPAWLAQKIRGTPFGVIVHGADVSMVQTRNHKRLINSLLRSAKAIYANSTRTSEVVKTIGVKPNKNHVMHPIVDTNLLLGKASPGKLKQALFLEGKKCILTVCRLVEGKGCDTVIQAMPAILKEIPEAHYVIVGCGPYEDRLKEIVRLLDIESHVTFTGHIPRDELSSYYMMCDVFAMISREFTEIIGEGFGLVYLEANLFGKPVVAGRSGGVADAVLDGKTGLMVEPNKPSEVAESIIRLLLDPVLARRLGELGRTRALEEFSGQSAIQKIRDVIVQGL